MPFPFTLCKYIIYIHAIKYNMPSLNVIRKSFVEREYLIGKGFTYYLYKKAN